MVLGGALKKYIGLKCGVGRRSAKASWVKCGVVATNPSWSPQVRVFVSRYSLIRGLLPLLRALAKQTRAWSIVQARTQSPIKPSPPSPTQAKTWNNDRLHVPLLETRRAICRLISPKPSIESRGLSTTARPNHGLGLLSSTAAPRS